MKLQSRYLSAIPILAALAAAGCSGTSDEMGTRSAQARLDPGLVAQGKEIFRSDTFGNEAFWTDALGMNKVIASAVDPKTALAVGL
jgi:hypothetical protein